MIILDAADQQAKLDPPVAGPTLRLPDRAAGRSFSPLPDYETSQAQHGLIFQKPTQARADRRFWRATLYALAIYVLLTLAVGLPLLVQRLNKDHHGPPPWPPPHEEVVRSTNLQKTPNAEVFMMESVGCPAWEDSHDIPSQSFFGASLSHTFSPQGHLSIRSNVSHEADDAVGVNGNITVDINPDPSISAVTISVSISATTSDLRQSTHACFADQGSNRGLSLYIPGDLQKGSVRLDIIMLFPQSTSTLSFDALTTYLPMFPQAFGNLSRNMTFDQVSIEGASMDISCDFIQAHKITVKNALAGISGSFNASERLVLDNVGGPIFANINVVQASDRHGPTFFSVDSGNSEIDANVTLQVTSHFSDPINFMGTVKNFNGPVSLNVAHDANTPPASLDLRVSNNQAPSNVTLDSKYVGSFDVQTKLATLDVKESKEDPSSDPYGENQERKYFYDSKTSTRILGWAGWGKRKSKWDPKGGHVEIVSSLSPILLQIGSSAS